MEREATSRGIGFPRRSTLSRSLDASQYPALVLDPRLTVSLGARVLFLYASIGQELDRNIAFSRMNPTGRSVVSGMTSAYRQARYHASMGLISNRSRFPDSRRALVKD